jgi:hypothetical protein
VTPRLSLLAEPAASWQMRYGERYVLEGVLCDLRPELAIEVGTARGGSLRRIAAHAREVHSFDVDPGVAAVVAALPNATAHIGDSRETLPAFLAGAERDGRNVDFALVDGDHSSDGVRRDVEAVLASGACGRTVLMLHDTANEDVRRGLEELDLPSHPKVDLCLLDFFAGRLVVRDHVYSRQCWNGLGLVVLDAAREPGPPVVELDHEDVPLTLRLARDALAATD